MATAKTLPPRPSGPRNPWTGQPITWPEWHALVAATMEEARDYQEAARLPKSIQAAHGYGIKRIDYMEVECE